MDAGDGSLDFEDVLRSLDQQQVDAPLDEAGRLLAEDVDEVVEGNVGEVGVIGGGKLAGRANRAGDEAGAPGLRRVFVGEAAGEGCARAVDVEDAVLEAVLLHGDAICTEGVGFDDVDTDVEEGAMDL